MNSFKTLAITLLALTSGSAALAEGPLYDAPVPGSSVTTRAEVRMAALQARAAGQIASGEQAFVAAPSGVPLTRAQVVAETLEAIRIGAIQRGEQSSVISDVQLERIRMAGQKALATTTAGL